MSDSNDTSAIDEKKTKNNSPSSTELGSIKKFFTTLFITIILIVVYFSFGALILYGCKLGQSNILPTDQNCFPYNEEKPEIKSIFSNIFITLTDPALSMKINFPYDKYNASNKILDLFRKYKNEPNSNFLANYFINIIESLIQFNYSSLNFSLNTLNGLPEYLIILLGPIIMPFIATFIFLLDHLYLIYLWFSNMEWFFKHNSATNNDNSPKWESVTLSEPSNYVFSIGFVILFLILFWVLLAVLPVLPFLTMSWSILSMLGYKSQMNDKIINVGTIVKDVFKYYKVLVMSIFSFFIIVSAFSNLGNVSGLFSILTFILILWGVISIDIFKGYKPENLSPLVSSDQAIKKCSLKSLNTGFLDNLFSNQKGGSQILKDLKKLSKSLLKK